MRKLEIAGRHVLVTGASTGIGRHLAECFAREGANLSLSAHPGEAKNLEQVAAMLGERFSVATNAIPVDLAATDGPEQLHGQAVERTGPVHVLVNNAGVLFYGGFHEIPLEHHRLLVNVNIMAYTALMRLCLPHMVSARAGGVLNVASVSAYQPTPKHAAYGASKSFVLALSRAVRQEVRPHGVRITALCPPYTKTPLLESGGFPGQNRWIRMLGLADPRDVAVEGVRALRADRAEHIPGILHVINHKLVGSLVPNRIMDRLSGGML
ncbi:MAG: SDR family NAD(P)-dependent oxidoreductase [Desulfatibacillaceae bacterium]